MPDFHRFTHFSDGVQAHRTSFFFDVHPQAKALDSVLNEVNNRFGKGSIMKLGGTSQVV